MPESDARSPTLRASFSGIFLQTLPELVTPLKGHSLSPCSCPPTRSAALRKVWVLITLRASLSGTFLQMKNVVNQCLEFGYYKKYNDCGSNLASVVSNVVSHKRNIWYNLRCLLLTNLLPFKHHGKTVFISWQFFETYGIINYGDGWRKDVVNQCLECAISKVNMVLNAHRIKP